MSIRTIELHRLRVPLTVPYKLSFGAVTHFDTIIVHMRDAAGASGLGEATLLTGYTDETIDGAWALSLLLGRRTCGLDLAAARAALTVSVATDPFAATAFITAIDMLERHPVLAIGAPARVPLLGIVNAMDEPAIAAEIERLLDAGYRTLKVKVGFEGDADSHRVRFIQRTLGERALIRLDANQGYDRDTACRFAAGLDPRGIELFEQPCAAHDWDAAVAVARVATVPMMLDESIYGEDDIRRAADLGCARYIKLKLMKLGSVERLMRALALIRELGMQPVLGNGVACEVGCWMEACAARLAIDNAGEMNGFLKPAEGLTTHRMPIEQGAIVLTPQSVPQLNEDALARVRIAHARFA